MAEDDDEGSRAGASAAADGVALAGASRDTADAYLRKQSRFVDLQSENLIEQNSFELSHLRWRRFNDQMKGALQIMVVLLGLVVVVGLGAAMWNASQAEGLVVDAFSVPPDYIQAGIAGDVIADDMTAKIAAVRDFASANSLAHSNDVREDRAGDIKVEIPETGISLAEAWRYLRRWLGNERHLNGSLRMLPGGRVALTVSLGGADTFRFTGKADELDALEQQAAERVFGAVDPVNVVLYLGAKGRYAEALAAAAHNVAIASGPRDLGGAYSLYANMIRAVTGDARRAFAMAHLAIALDPKAAPQHMEALSSARALGHDEEVLAQARIIATLRPEDNIRGWRTGTGVAYVKDIGAIWRAGDTGDFAAVSTLICTQVCSRADAAMLHAEALARLHDPGAAGARIDDARASGQPDPSDLARTGYYIAAAQDDWRAAADAARRYRQSLMASPASDGFKTLLMQTRAMPLLARALASAGDGGGAQNAVAGTPLDCYACVLARGEVAARRHDWSGAAAWYADAVRLAPSLPFAYADWGEMLLHKGDFGGAIAKLTAANQKGPHFADPLELWGEALVASNRSDLALAKFAAAARYAPNWGRLHLKWGEALWWLGRKEDARRQFAVAGTLFLTGAERNVLNGFASAR
jgi:tetratricopeptide (TPR) repeat protein